MPPKSVKISKVDFMKNLQGFKFPNKRANQSKRRVLKRILNLIESSFPKGYGIGDSKKSSVITQKLHKLKRCCITMEKDPSSLSNDFKDLSSFFINMSKLIEDTFPQWVYDSTLDSFPANWKRDTTDNWILDHPRLNVHIVRGIQQRHYVRLRDQTVALYQLKMYLHDFIKIPDIDAVDMIVSMEKQLKLMFKQPRNVLSPKNRRGVQYLLNRLQFLKKELSKPNARPINSAPELFNEIITVVEKEMKGQKKVSHREQVKCAVDLVSSLAEALPKPDVETENIVESSMELIRGMFDSVFHDGDCVLDPEL